MVRAMSNFREISALNFSATNQPTQAQQIFTQCPFHYTDYTVRYSHLLHLELLQLGFEQAGFELVVCEYIRIQLAVL